MSMRKCIPIFMLLFLTGCPSPHQHYQPVDWWQESPIEQKIEPIHEDQVPATIQTLLRLHNEQRELKGRAGFTLDPHLNEYAQKHAEWMARHNNLQHSNINKLMGKYSTAGENIAWNQGSEKEVVNAWMNSAGHRANIMNRSFTNVGFGVAYDEKGEPYWCTCFGG